MVDHSSSGKDFEIPVAIKEKWQRMVNIMSNLLRVPTGFIMKVNGPHIQIFTANVANTNPYYAGQNFELDGLYCEEVLKSDNLLFIPDALKDPEWENNPEIPAGFIYYLGYPVHWPSGKMFGTICVQDYEDNPHATDNKALLEEFRSVCELDLLLVHRQSEREKLIAKLEQEVVVRKKAEVELQRMHMNLEGIVEERTLDLRMSEERFRLIVEQAGDAFFVLDYDGIIFDVNSKACESLGYSRGELLGMKISEVDTDVDEKQHKLQLWNPLEPGDHVTFKGVHRRKDESVFPVEVRLGRLDMGHNKFLLALARDVTERKKIEQIVEEQLAFEQLVSELSGQFVNLSAEEIDSAITQGLGRVAEFIDADRASIIQPEGDGYNFSHYWSRQDIAPSPPQAASMGSYPELSKQVLRGSTVVFLELDDLPAEAEEDRQMFIKLGIQSLLSLPLVANDVPVGAVSFSAVKHKCHWHETVIKRMQMVAVLFSQALERKRSQMALAERLQFQNLVSNIAQKFIGISSGNFKQARQDALAEIGRYFEADAVRLYRLSPQGDIVEMRNVWTSEHSVAVEETAEMHKMKYPHLAAHYLQGETIIYGRPDECPQLPDLLKILEYAKITAGVGVPLEIDDSGVDVFALANNQSEHVWPKDIVKYCKVLGQILLSAMRRSDAEVSLQDRYDEIKQLKKRLMQENIHLRKEIEVLYSHDEIVGKSRAIKTVLSQAEQVAKQETSVLVLGETGTGKELLARAIHNISPRKARTMITVNCAALPPTLVEGELFGREKGAYTGALTKQAGRFEIADKSTIFLDEIGDLPLEMQAKLLRVLQEGQFERLGSTKTITVDVRIIAATNHDLEQAVRTGKFRKDLFYRLNVFPITVPPLRDRAEDIPMLAWAFVKDLGTRMGKTVEKISKETMDMLQRYTWPGNVRELRNIIERSMILHSGQTLHIEIIRDINQEIDQPTSLKEMERNHILSILTKTHWKVSGKNGAAEALGLKESTLRARMAKLGIKRKQ